MCITTKDRGSLLEGWPGGRPTPRNLSTADFPREVGAIRFSRSMFNGYRFVVERAGRYVESLVSDVSSRVERRPVGGPDSFERKLRPKSHPAAGTKTPVIDAGSLHRGTIGVRPEK